MPALDTELATGLKAAKTKPMFFALIAKGTTGKLLVAKKKVPAPAIASAKKECGGGTVYQGKCHIDEDGALIFEVAAEPPGTLAATTKKIIKEEAGLSFKAVEFHVNASAEQEAEEGQVEEGAAPPVGTAAVPAAPAADPAGLPARPGSN